MRTTKGTAKICSRGHKFYRSSGCPVCPIYWSGYYKKQSLSDFPKDLAAPALRALLNAKITKLADLRKYTEEEISELHGMGPELLNSQRPLCEHAV